jgi:hypothetical protein
VHQNPILSVCRVGIDIYVPNELLLYLFVICFGIQLTAVIIPHFQLAAPSTTSDRLILLKIDCC